MAITDDLRKTLSNSTPVHFAAGTADLAAEKLRGLPATIDKLRERAPEHIQAVREVELPKLREQAQTLALRGAGLAIDYAAKAREVYGELAERGKEAIDGRREQRNGPAGAETHEVIVERSRDAAPVTEAVTRSGTESAAGQWTGERAVGAQHEASAKAGAESTTETVDRTDEAASTSSPETADATDELGTTSRQTPPSA